MEVPVVVVIALVLGALNLGFLMGRFFERWGVRNGWRE